ncbi:MAG: hypothetical protein H6707_03170 [Deltaproteobacteria bacterium]|nr:hypothetical protein [Deltaproteobacteria bacterium]
MRKILDIAWRTRRTLAAPAFALAVCVAFASTWFSGCEDDDVGLPCNVGDTTAPKGIDIDSASNDCRSRICIRYDSPSARRLCTKPCETSDDCPDSTPACPGGFTCVIGETVPGGLQCCKLCVCRTHVPAGDTDPQAASCQGKPVTCPNI